MRFALLALAAFAVLVMDAPRAEAQEVNCRRPASAADAMVCRYPQLLDLDDRVARRYAHLRRELYGRDRNELERDHLQFRRARRDCYDNARCLEAMYHRRLDELREYRRRY
ncbi:MAG: hypothetical protein IPK23_11400 [Rhizobiales bacterium]|jgi:uncharacterized protein|nr:hypothetical protein [Hyphomicrobiales bacterium]